MRNQYPLLAFIAVLCATTSLGATERPVAQITVCVRADDGSAVTGIVVGVSTFWRHIPGEGFGRDESRTIKEVTDTNGLVTLSVPSVTGEIAYGARSLLGFYNHGSTWFRFTNAIAGKWQPWNPTVDLRLKKIVNPVALYAKRFGEGKPMKLPAIGKPVGFDLLKGDWVAPYGQGERGDFIFKLDTKLGGMTKNGYQMHDSEFTVDFLNEGDGIQSIYAEPLSFKRSALRLPRYAPEQGYETNLVKQAYCHEGAHSPGPREGQNHFFRVRTKKDDKGNIVSALYGKIHGEIEWGWNGFIRFTYYLNPTPNDRNLEFDPKRNLFKNLKSMEQVTDP